MISDSDWAASGVGGVFEVGGMEVIVELSLGEIGHRGFYV
jgi:hypothetical protein